MMSLDSSSTILLTGVGTERELEINGKKDQVESHLIRGSRVN